jgi:hypothetical protein
VFDTLQRELPTLQVGIVTQLAAAVQAGSGTAVDRPPEERTVIPPECRVHAEAKLLAGSGRRDAVPVTRVPIVVSRTGSGTFLACKGS